LKNREKPVANPYAVLRDMFDDWAILFTPDTGRGSFLEYECQARCFGLNPTGVYLWKLLDGEHTLDALLEEIRDGIEGVPEEASDHVVAFVNDLVARGLAWFDNTGSGLPDTPDGRALHPEKCSASAGRFHHRQVAKDKRLRGTNKKIAYEKPRLIDFAASSGLIAHGDCEVTQIPGAP
jgi:SynChlorMet cassette protein ScmD